jgi:hypothetical protein
LPFHPSALKVLGAQSDHRIVGCLCDGVAKDLDSAPRIVEFEKLVTHIVAGLGEIAAIIVLGLWVHDRHIAQNHGDPNSHNHESVFPFHHTPLPALPVKV